MVALGAPQETIDEALAAKQQAEDPDFEVFSDNEQSVTIFRSVTTQWRRGGMTGQRVGLDYNVLPFVMSTLGVTRSDRKQVFEDVQLMENEVLKVIAESAE